MCDEGAANKYCLRLTVFLRNIFNLQNIKEKNTDLKKKK